MTTLHPDWRLDYQVAAAKIELAFAPARVTHYIEVKEGVRFYIDQILAVNTPEQAIQSINDQTKYTVVNYSLKPDLTVTLTGF